MAKLDVAIDATKAVAGARTFGGAIAAMRVSARAGAGAAAGMSTATKAMSIALLAVPAAGIAASVVLGKVLVTAAIRASKAMIEVAGAAEEIEAKFEAVFKREAKRAAAELDSFGNVVGRSTIDLKEMAAGLQDTLVPMGLARDLAADFAVEITKLSTDVASFNNAQDSEAASLFTSAIIGNHEAVRRYGIILTAATVEAEAHRRGLTEVGAEMTAQEKVLARISLLFKMTGDAQGDAARTSTSYQNTLKALSGQVHELQGAIGKDLTKAFKDMIHEGIGMENAMVSIEIALRSSAGAAAAAITAFGELASKIIEIARYNDRLDALFEQTKLKNLNRDLLENAERWQLTTDGVQNFKNAMHAQIRELAWAEGSTMSLGEATMHVREEYERLAASMERSAMMRDFEEMGVHVDDVAAAFIEAKKQSALMADSLESPADKMERVNELVRGMFSDLFQERDFNEARARMDELLANYQRGKAEMEGGVASTPTRGQTYDEEKVRLQSQLVQTFEMQRKAIEDATGAEYERIMAVAESIGLSHGQIKTLTGLAEKLYEEGIAAVNAAEAEEKLAVARDLAAEAGRAEDERSRALIDARDREIEQAHAWAKEHGILYGGMQDGINGLGDAFGSAALGFSDFGDAASNALRSMAANMVSAAAQAAIFMAIIKPLLGAMGLSPGQIGTLFPQFGGGSESAMGNLFSGGQTVSRFAKGGFPAGMISSPTAFAMGGGIGIAGERGQEFGWHSQSAIAPLKRDPVSGEIGVRSIGGGGSSRPSMTFQTTINVRGGQGDPLGRGFRRSVRHYERELRTMSARIGG